MGLGTLVVVLLGWLVTAAALAVVLGRAVRARDAQCPTPQERRVLVTASGRASEEPPHSLDVVVQQLRRR